MLHRGHCKGLHVVVARVDDGVGHQVCGEDRHARCGQRGGLPSPQPDHAHCRQHKHAPRRREVYALVRVKVGARVRARARARARA